MIDIPTSHMAVTASDQVGADPAKPNAEGAPAVSRDALAGKVNTVDPDVAAQVKAELMDSLKVLRAFAMSLTRNSAAADDLVQETVLKAWANLNRFEPGTNMRAWLFTILRNTFYSTHRKASREVADADGEMAAKLATKPAHDGRLHLRDFRVAFAQLPDEQREALMLVGALQYAYEEAADMCGVKIGTIKSRLNRGRARLAELMDLDPEDAMELTDRATTAVMLDKGFKSI